MTRTDLTRNDQPSEQHAADDAAGIPLFVYVFFFFHMALFGLSGFFMAYAAEGPDASFLLLHGGIAISVYLVFYLNFFGWDEVRWMWINAGLGLFGIYVEIGWILGLFGTQLGDYPGYRHIIPFLYYILYTFLLRQAVLDLARARHNAVRRRLIEQAYVVISVLIYGALFLRNQLP